VNGSKFSALWRGDISMYKSASEADSALAAILAFYTNDTDQIKRIMCRSGLYGRKNGRIEQTT